MKNSLYLSILIFWGGSLIGLAQTPNTPKASSVTRNSDMKVITSVKTGEVYLGGYNTHFNEPDGVIRGYGVFVKIWNGKARVRELQFISSIDEIFFLDKLNGWIQNYTSGIFKTRDGGDTWQKLDNLKPGVGLFFLNGNLGWYFQNDEGFAKIENGGVKKIIDFDDFPLIKKIQFTNSLDGWLLKVTNSRSIFQNSKDGGKSWKEMKIDTNDVYNFQFINDKNGYVITDSVFSTNDGGKNWELLKDKVNGQGYVDLFFLDKNIGWIIGKDFCLTKNSGKSWKCSEYDRGISPEQFEIRNILFTNLLNGYLLTDKGLYFTRNGGKTWKKKKILLNKTEF
jgi:photosystem II stability/assembly factor-like uncharacterized protein